MKKFLLFFLVVCICFSLFSCGKNAPEEVVEVLESRCDEFIKNRLDDTNGKPKESNISYNIISVEKDYEIDGIYYYTAYIDWIIETYEESDTDMMYVMFLANDISNAVSIEDGDRFECDGKIISIGFINDYAYDALGFVINGEYRNQPEECKDCDKYFDDIDNISSIRETDYCVKCYKFIHSLYEATKD